MINAVHRDKPSIFIGAMLREKFISCHRAMNEADSYLHSYEECKIEISRQRKVKKIF